MGRELDRLAAGCLLPSFGGPEPPAWILGWLDQGLGGVVLFASNVEDGEGVPRLTARLRPGAVIAVDEEGGDVTRLEAARGSSYPGNLALGVVDDVSATRSVAGAMAADLAAVGVTLNLAPVADVNTNPDNPVIGVRSFGSEPGVVARHVAAFVEGTQAQGVAACAKHFPGHGDTRADSHLELPVVEGDVAAAVAPFRAAVAAGVRAVMTGHLLVPAVDAESPATLSRAIVTGLLREELGFDGLVITDALDMAAVAGTVGLEESAVRALEAGVDALCLGPSIGPDGVEGVHTAIVGAVRSGRLAERRLAEAAGRVASVHVPARPGVTNRAVGAAAAERALAVEGDVAVGEAPVVVELVAEPNVAAGEAAFTLGDAVWARRPDAVVVRVGETATADARAAVDGAPGRPVVALRDASRHPWQQALARELLGLRPDAVLVELGVPGTFPDGTTASIRTYGAGRVNLEAAARALAGDVRVA